MSQQVAHACEVVNETKVDSGKATITKPAPCSRLTGLKVSRVAMGHKKITSRVVFDTKVDLKNVRANNGALEADFTLCVESFPLIMRVEMQGTAVLPMKGFGEEALESLTEAEVSEVAIDLYRRSYEQLYLLSESLGLPFPSPWLVKDVHLVQPLSQHLGAQRATTSMSEVGILTR